MSAPVTQSLPVDVLLPNAAGIKKAAELLRQGKLVVLPTETVYGIAVSLASTDACATARQLKIRAAEGVSPPASPWVIHVAQLDDLLSWVPNISAVGRRLITKSVPGPVAFQVKLDAAAQTTARTRLSTQADETLMDGFLTLRCPEFSATQEILAKSGVPVAIFGAGTRSQPAVFELAELPPALWAEKNSSITAVIDGGITRYRRSSTLVRIDGEQYAVVRPGVIDERIIQRMADLTLLFVCSGNTCRSPMAAAITARLLADKFNIAPSELPLRHIVVQSAGLHANKGIRATEEAAEAVQEFGGDLTTHFSQSALTDGGSLLRRADMIYTMTAAHREEVLDLFPWAQRKTFRLDAEGDIADPIGGSVGVYQQVARRLHKVIRERLRELAV